VSIDLEATLTKTIQNSPAVAAVLLRDGQLFSSSRPGVTFDPTEYLPMVQVGTDSQLSTPEFHLLPFEQTDREPVLVLTQKVDADTFCLLVFPLKTSLSIAEQACQQLMQQLNNIESPKLGIPDLSELRLRQAVIAGNGSWQDELFQLEAGSNTMKNPCADSAADSAKKAFWYQVF
jgi:hypothetical protein